jgi:hypothetical protein
VAATETIVWACVAFSLLLADVVLQWQELRRVRPVAAKVQPAVRNEAGLAGEPAAG